MNVINALSASTEHVIPLLKSFVPGFNRRNQSSDICELGAIRTVAYRCWPEEAPLAAAWNELSPRVPQATVFNSARWQQAVLEWPQRLGRLALITVWRDSRLLAALPLQERRGNRLESAGAIVSDYLDPLIDPAEQETAWRAILSFLRRQRAGQRIALRNLRSEAACRRSLPGLCASEGFDLEEAQCGSSSFLPLQGTWDDYLASLRAGDRKELKRKLCKAESQAAAVLDCNDEPVPTRLAAERVFSFIEAGGGERGIKCRWLFRALLASAGETLAEQKWLRVFSLRLQQRASAGVIAFRSPGGYMAWATGYDVADKPYSPGIVTFAMTIRRAIEEGASYLDLLRGHSDYKARLGGRERPMYQLTLTPRAT